MKIVINFGEHGDWYWIDVEADNREGILEKNHITLDDQSASHEITNLDETVRAMMALVREMDEKVGIARTRMIEDDMRRRP